VDVESSRVLALGDMVHLWKVQISEPMLIFGKYIPIDAGYDECDNGRNTKLGF
jgi:hypothetical protein